MGFVLVTVVVFAFAVWLGFYLSRRSPEPDRLSPHQRGVEERAQIASAYVDAANARIAAREREDS